MRRFHRKIGILGAVLLSALLVSAAGAQQRTPIPTEADGVVATEIEKRLSADRTVNAQTVKIDVRGGVVTLTGRVPTEAAKERAEKIAADVAGVTEVHNRISAATGEAEALPADKVPDAH